MVLAKDAVELYVKLGARQYVEVVVGEDDERFDNVNLHTRLDVLCQ